MNNPYNMFGNINNMIAQFNQFQSNFSGDPKQKVQDLLNSGQMSKEQFNKLSSMAQAFQIFMKRY